LRERHALVVGVSGIVGYRIAEALAGDPGWSVTGVSRRPPADRSFAHVPLDLTDAAECFAKLRDIGPVDHVYYAARYEPTASPSDLVEMNLRMLRNVVEAAEAVSPELRHIHVVHGTKYYGAPFGRYRTPSREDDPRCVTEIFYHAQQDFIVERQQHSPWTWSISRPQAVSDVVPNSASNLPWCVAVYAAICKARGVSLTFPGSPGGYGAIYQCTDARHLARAVTWMASEPRCANQIFNVTNGDYFRWENLWPVVADWFEVPVGPAGQVRLEQAMPAWHDLWRGVAEAQGLVSKDIGSLVSWRYLDFALGPDWDRMSDVTKLHKFGFHHVIETEAMFRECFESYRKQRLIP
jgi:nucleoside-diphosphate-sugar epimerase